MIRAATGHALVLCFELALGDRWGSTSEPWTMPLEINPYQSPQPDEPVFATDDERIRKEHLGYETGIRLIGLSFVASGIASWIMVTIVTVGVVAQATAGRALGWTPAVSFSLAGTAVFFVGRALRRFNRRARIAAILILIPISIHPCTVLLGGPGLYALVSRKGRYVFTDEYQRIIAETPEMLRRTPALNWIVAACLVLFAIAFSIGTWASLR